MLFLDLLPVWVEGGVFFILLLIALQFGFRAGFRRREVWNDADEGGGNLVLTSILGLLGLILAFTFADGVSHYKARKAAVVAESNALGTAFLRADMVADPGRSELKQALYEYARIRSARAESIKSTADLQKVLEESSRALGKLWPITLKILDQKPPGPIEASLVASVNEVIDYHTIRTTALHDKLPVLVIVLLVCITAAAMAVAGFNAGLSGRISHLRLGIFALVLTSVVLVIRDFDRPVAGFIKVNPDSIQATVAQMKKNLTE